MKSTSTTGNDPIPKWIIWYGVIVMVGAPLANAVMTFAGTGLGMVILADGSEIDTGLFKYAVRNLAAAVITGYALYKRSAAMLLIIFFMRFMTEAGDLLDSLLFGETDAVGIASFVAMMFFLTFVHYTIAIKKLSPMVR